MLYANNMSAPPNTGLWTGAASRANMGGVVASVLGIVGEQQIRNAPPPAGAVAQVAPQQQPQQPKIVWSLHTSDRLQEYLNSCPPGLTELALNHCQITSLVGVKFPPSLEVLELRGNKITSIAGGDSKRHGYAQFIRVQFPPGLKKLDLNSNQITSIEGVQFPPGLTELDVGHNQIEYLSGVQFPPGLKELHLESNQITSIANGQFPPGLTLLNLADNKIFSIAGAKFPPGLTTLWLENNKISTLERVQFPPDLTELDLEDNKISSLLGVNFPPNLTDLALSGNPISLLKGISPNVMQLIEPSFPAQVKHFREKSASNAARQSQKADSKFISDSTQKSMVTMLKTLTAFFHEGMEARARQHEEQVKKENEERGRQIFFVRGTTGKTYSVPLNTTMSIQAVLDYLNSHYYISALEDCGVMHLIFSRQRLEPERTLADYNVQAESTLNLVCKFRPNLFQGGSKKRRPKKSKQRPKKQRNKSTRKQT